MIRATPASAKRPGRRLLGSAAVLAACCAITAANAPTLGAAAASWYHHYEITQPSYEARYGLWAKLDIPARFQVNGIHSTLLHNGDVLIMAGSGNNQAFFSAGTFQTLLLNPTTMRLRLIHTPWDLFCAGHIELPDGNILVAGGTARYENLHPTHAGGSMTVINNDPARCPASPTRRTWRPAPRSCCRRRSSRSSWCSAAVASASRTRPPPAPR